MGSKARVEANRQNAKKSTGPRTPSGKAIASMNAVKHGLCSRKPLIPGEDEAEFARFTSEWLGLLQPAGPEQSLLAGQIVMSAWQMRRLPQLEAGLLSMYMRKDKDVHPFAMYPEVYPQLSRLDRHQAALQRTFDRARQELKQIQEETADSTDSTDEQNEANGGEALPMVGVTDTISRHEDPTVIPLPAIGGSDSGQTGDGLVD